MHCNTTLIWIFPHNFPDALLPTSSMLVGMKGASMFLSSKKTSLAEQSAVSRLAMIVLVRIATSIEPDRSPITTTGFSSGRLGEGNHRFILGLGTQIWSCIWWKRWRVVLNVIVNDVSGHCCPLSYRGLLRDWSNGESEINALGWLTN